MAKPRIDASGTLYMLRVRLREQTAQEVRQFAIDRGKTTSEVLRQMVEDWLASRKRLRKRLDRLIV